ncbi:unnamed protein product [Hanseniaspora opuntiae]
MSTDTLRFFLKSILESHCHFLSSYFKFGQQKSIKNKVQNNFQSEANVFVQHSNVHVVKGSDMTKLLSVCKKNGFTFNSLLLSLLSVSGPENLMNIKSENKDSATFRHEISVPLNARRFLLRGEALQKKIGMFVTGGKIEACDIKLKLFENDPYGSVINLAKDLNNKVQNVCVQNFQKTVDVVGLLNLLADKTMKNLDSIFKENPKKICDYELSNLGSTNKKHTHLIKRLVFNQSFNPRSSNMTVSCITGGFSGDCVLSFMTTKERELCTWGDRFEKVLELFLSSFENGSIRE